MKRHSVMVLTSDLPRMLQSILQEPLQNAADIDLIQPDAVQSEQDVTRAATVIVSQDRYLALAASLDFASLIVAVSMDGQQATAYRAGRTPQVIDRFSHEDLLPLIRENLSGFAPTPPSFWKRLWGGRPGRMQDRAAPVSPGTRDGPLSPAATGRIAAESARLAARVLRHRSDTAPQQGPGRTLIDVAARIAAAAGPGAEGAATRLPGLARLTALFQLSADEQDLLSLATLVEVDPGTARLVALLNDHFQMTRPTPAVLADLGGDPAQLVLGLMHDGPLVSRGLVIVQGDGPMAMRGVQTHPDVLAYILGQPGKPPFPVLPARGTGIADLAIPDALRTGIVQIGDRLRAGGGGAAVAVIGDRGVGRQEIARLLAAPLRRKVICVPGAALSGPQALAVLRREAMLNAAAILIDAPDQSDPDQLCALMEQPDEVVFLVCDPDTLGPILRRVRRPVVEIAAPRRDLAQRARLWTALGPPGLTPAEIDDIAARFDFGRDQIRPAVEIATQRSRGVPDLAALKSACETLRDTRFAGTAERLVCPFEPDDIILSAQTQAELDLAMAWARDGARLFSPDGPGAALRAGGGLSCLFSGPPGVGKTMAAQIIARQVDYALYRIDLSQVMDKFIGESEKRLAALFDEAERSRVALFFDEADALFGKRTQVRDSHDRYANITVDYLLQRIEAFDGFAILATNLAGNIDEAFLRRVRIRAEFAPPGPQDRRRIWSRLLPPADQRAPDVDIALLADPFDLVGGEIRNAIYTAHLLASQRQERLGMVHCVRGLWREVRKIGRVTDLAHLGPWRHAVEGDQGLAPPGLPGRPEPRPSPRPAAAL